MQPKQDKPQLNSTARDRSRCIFGAPRPSELSASLQTLLVGYINLDARPLLADPTLTLDWVLAIATHSTATATTLDSRLAIFFREFAERDPCSSIRRAIVVAGDLPEMLERFPAVHCLVHYLATAPSFSRSRHISLVAGHIIQVLRGLADGTEANTNPTPATSPNVANPAWAYLAFVLLLVGHSADAATIFNNRGFLQLVYRLINRYMGDTNHLVGLWHMYHSLVATIANSVGGDIADNVILSNEYANVGELLRAAEFTGLGGHAGQFGNASGTMSLSITTLPSALSESVPSRASSGIRSFGMCRVPNSGNECD